MTGHVPVRFSESVIARVKTLASIDGVTVSTWIRNLVLKEVERRSPPTTGSSYELWEIFVRSGTEPSRTELSFKVNLDGGLLTIP